MDPRVNPLSVDFLTSQETKLSAFDVFQTLDKPSEDHDESASSGGDSELATSISTTMSGGEEANSPTQPHKFAPLANQVIDEYGNVHNKPNVGYVAIISTAILNSPEKKLLLCDLYDIIMDTYPYYKYQKSPSWRNSIRHNLSLNECFVKNGRSVLGKGNYWSVHTACMDDFKRGDFRRRRARRKSKRGSFQQIQCLPASAAPPYPTHYGSSVPYSSSSVPYSSYTPMTAVDTNLSLPYHQYTPVTTSHGTSLPIPKAQTAASTTKMPHSYDSTNLWNTETSGYDTHLRGYTPSGTMRSEEKAPPPNINAAHMAQLGLAGAYNTAYHTPLRNTYIDTYNNYNVSSYSSGYGSYMTSHGYSTEPGYFADILSSIIN